MAAVHADTGDAMTARAAGTPGVDDLHTHQPKVGLTELTMGGIVGQ